MPATAGRVRMPANNRLSVSDSLRTSEIWQKSVGYDPYAPTDTQGAAPGGEGGGEIQEKARGLFVLARLTGSSSAVTPGACRKCGQVGHLAFQCFNDRAGVPKANAEHEKAKEEEEEDEDEDEDEEIMETAGIKTKATSDRPRSRDMKAGQRRRREESSPSRRRSDCRSDDRRRRRHRRRSRSRSSDDESTSSSEDSSSSSEDERKGSRRISSRRRKNKRDDRRRRRGGDTSSDDESVSEEESRPRKRKSRRKDGRRER